MSMSLDGLYNQYSDMYTSNAAKNAAAAGSTAKASAKMPKLPNCATAAAAS